jgi:hypothetical protein
VHRRDAECAEKNLKSDESPQNEIVILALIGMTTDQRIDNLSVDTYELAPQHFLYFLPLPQGHGSLRPTFSPERTTCVTCMSPEPAMRACSSSRFFLR